MVTAKASARHSIIVLACVLAMAACAGHQATATDSARAAPVCRTSQLKITMARSGAATATVGGQIWFTSHASAPCQLTGWPTLVAVTAAGRPAAAIRRLSTMFGPNLTRVPVVTINPAATAEAVFTGGDVPGPGATTCPPPYRQLRITPPGNTQHTVISAWLPYLGAYLPACTPIWISPVVAFPVTDSAAVAGRG
jgi:hypothetical protein